MSEYLESLFPRLKRCGYEVTSPQSDRPNCIGYVVGSPLYFDPVARGIGGYYWPDGIRADDSVQAWRELFALCFGYEECADGSVEANMDKIAIYADREGDAAHVARQLPSGQWTSKLGKLEDITHDTLEALICDDYATVVILMRRQRT